MKVFIFGINGGVGRRLAQCLAGQGHEVNGLVRRAPHEELSRSGIPTCQGDIVRMPIEEIATVLRGCDAVVFTAGAGGRDGADATTQVDGKGPLKVAAAAENAGIRRFMLVSVFPEAWRERPMPSDFEHYMSQKKIAETELVTTDLDWVILRPSSLNNDDGHGQVDLGPAEMHGEISRSDVAATLVELLREPAVRRRILEVTSGSTTIREAVAALVA